jgi:hypothetical protein
VVGRQCGRSTPKTTVGILYLARIVTAIGLGDQAGAAKMVGVEIEQRPVLAHGHALAVEEVVLGDVGGNTTAHTHFVVGEEIEGFDTTSGLLDALTVSVVVGLNRW